MASTSIHSVCAQGQVSAVLCKMHEPRILQSQAWPSSSFGITFFLKPRDHRGDRIEIHNQLQHAARPSECS